jgi:predicted nuclease with TOPRIM domain
VKKKEPKKEYKDAELNKLKRRVKRLENENSRLKSELNSYEQAFKKTTKFLKDHTDDISLEDLIKAAREDKSLKQVEIENVHNVCPKCFSAIKTTETPVGTIKTCTKCDYRDMVKK